MSNTDAAAFDCLTRRATRPAAITARWVTRLARLALPQCCELCVAHTHGALLCEDCSADLPRIFAACPVCALPSSVGAVCGACLDDPPPYAATVAALAYTFPTDRLLHRIKYGGRLALVDWAGSLLATTVRSALALRVPENLPERIVALPLTKGRQRERGFNQAREIAVRVAQTIALPLTSPLVRISTGPPQTALPWAERQRNVRGAFLVCGDVRGARVALVDDVMTTGATLAEAARTLVQAGAVAVECWVVARTLPP